MRNEWSTIDSIKGVSPDWEILPLQEFSSPEKNSFVNGPFGSDLLSSELVLAGQPVIYIRDIRNGRYLRKSEVFVTNEKYQTLTACQVNYGDVIIAKVGDPPCESAVYDAHESGIVTQDVIRIRTEELRCSQFIAFILNSDIGKRQVKRIKISGTRDRVSLTDFKKIKFPHPPVSEQRKIAKILSTWDKAITTIEQLLAISQLQKKALMQQLLTGKKRLLDTNGVRFSGEWKKVRLGSVAEMNSGGTPKSSIEEYYGGSIPWVSIADMTKQGKWIDSTEKYLTELGLENSSARIYPKNSVLYAMYASIGECSIAKVPLSSSQAILGIRPKSGLDFYFLYFFLTSLKEKIKLLGQQGTQSNLNAGMVKDFNLNLPCLAEQQKIAAVLSSADKEVAVLQQKLDALQQEKKALMQQLLTGKRRVNTAEKEIA